ncbi:PilN domain-containing protein [Massilia sp. W12]|uniref:PilN domain-containing protein n=1 Tax=Massilia sp. W12 TaxID=3126507 RepID=UPI0030D59DEF
MIKINLLPHREARRKQAKTAFVAMLVLAALCGLIVVAVVGAVQEARITEQDQRNKLIKEANAKLDKKIADISKLKEEIEGLKARQQAVEDLQSDRNQPVLIMDELTKQTPEGIFFKSFKQEGQRILLTGYAQSNERVSELLRNLSNSQWLEKPDLKQIQLGAIGGNGKPNDKQAKKAYEFSMSVFVKRPREKEEPGKPGKPGKPGEKNAAASASASAQ